MVGLSKVRCGDVGGQFYWEKVKNKTIKELHWEKLSREKKVVKLRNLFLLKVEL